MRDTYAAGKHSRGGISAFLSPTWFEVHTLEAPGSRDTWKHLTHTYNPHTARGRPAKLFVCIEWSEKPMPLAQIKARIVYDIPPCYF